MAYKDKRGRKRETYRDPVTKKVKTRYLEHDELEKPLIETEDGITNLIKELEQEFSGFIKILQDYNNKELTKIAIEITGHQIQHSSDILRANPEIMGGKEAIEYLDTYIKILQNYINSLNKDEYTEDIKQEIVQINQLKEKWSNIGIPASVLLSDVNIVKKL